MKAILIDPETQTVSAVIAPDPEELESTEAVASFLDCHLVDMLATPPNINAVFWIDDEGLLKDNHYFAIPLFGHQLLAGKCLVYGRTGKGALTSPAFTAAELAQVIAWRPAPSTAELDRATRITIVEL